MDFDEFWKKITKELRTRRRIRNWTADKGYLNRGDFDAVYHGGNYMECILDNDSVQTVPKKDFELIYDNWEGYINGQIQRSWLVHDRKSRFTKYTISITHHYKHLM